MNSLQAINTLFRIKLAVFRHRILGLREESSLMVFVIISFVGGYWGAGYFCFHEAMRFLYNFPGLGNILLDRMFYLFRASKRPMLPSDRGAQPASNIQYPGPSHGRRLPSAQ